LPDEAVRIGEDLPVEAEFPAGLDVTRNVVGVEALLRDAAYGPQCGPVHLRFRLDRTDFVRQHELIETIENVESLPNELVMPDAGVREQDQPEILLFERLQNLQHRPVELEDIRRGDDQFLEIDHRADEFLKMPMEFLCRHQSPLEFPLHAGI